MNAQPPLLDEIEADELALIALLEQLRDAPDDTRHAELVEWARSPLWHPAGMIMEGWQGGLHRAAYRALEHDLKADTPGRRWWHLDRHIGRQSIVRLLGLGDDPSARYAAEAFKTWIDDDDRTWIAGAIGCPPLFDPARLLAWRHLDIRDVILWDPRTNEARLVGELPGTSLFVMPDPATIAEPKLTIWGDCGAFFRAWAARRARVAKLAQARAAGEWAHPICEPADGNLPGGLLIGDWMHAAWPHPQAKTIAAGAGITPAELHAAAFRAARVPQFEGV